MFHPIDIDVKNEDGKYVFVGKTCGTKLANNTKVQEILSQFPRLDVKGLRNAKDGVYTWLLYSTDDSNAIRFVATEVVSPFEIGTRHQAMAYNARTDASIIYGGGELLKKDGFLLFNLLSGTYSKRVLQFNYEQTLKYQMIHAFQIFFPEAEYDSSGSSYIYTVTTVPNAILELYKEIGYTVRLFAKRDEYVTFANAFWNFDFNIQHARKAMDKETDAEKKRAFQTVLLRNLEGLVVLLETNRNTVHGGTRTSRSKRRSSASPRSSTTLSRRRIQL